MASRSPEPGISISQSRQLRRKIELVSPALDRVAHALWTHPCLRDIYPEFLFMWHSIIRASVPLMEAALTVVRSRSASDPVAACLAEYFAEHIPEELDHDEWLLQDMEVLGLKRAQVLRRIPSPTVAALVGSQYYWIFHSDPVGVLGYIAVLEGAPPATGFLEDLVRRTGFPREAFRTHFKHAQLDPHHRDELNEVLDHMPLTAEQGGIVGASAIQTVSFLTDAIEELLEMHRIEVASDSAGSRGTRT